jgi:hypothetical protein
LTLAEAQLAVSALDALPGPDAVDGGQALVAICDSHGLDDARLSLLAQKRAAARNARPLEVGETDGR